MKGCQKNTRNVWLDLLQSQKKHGIQHKIQKVKKIQALSLAKECYSMKLDLLTNASVIDDAIRFISSNQKVCQRQILSEEQKAKANSRIIENQDSSSDIQRSEEEDNKQQSTTTNTIF